MYTTGSDAWAVGSNGAIIECTSSCYTGSTFTAVTSPTSQNLYGVSDLSGQATAWAVGAGGGGHRDQRRVDAQSTPAMSASAGSTLQTVSVQITNGSAWRFRTPTSL